MMYLEKFYQCSAFVELLLHCTGHFSDSRVLAHVVSINATCYKIKKGFETTTEKLRDCTATVK